MTREELSAEITESMSKTIGKRIDLLIEAYRNGMDVKEWYHTLTGAVNTLDSAVDQLLEQDLITAKDYNVLDEALDKLAFLEYAGTEDKEEEK